MPACALPIRKVFPPPRPSPYSPTSDYKVSAYSEYFIMYYGMLAKNLITTPYKFVSPSQLLKEITSAASSANGVKFKEGTNYGQKYHKAFLSMCYT